MKAFQRQHCHVENGSIPMASESSISSILNQSDNNEGDMNKKFTMFQGASPQERGMVRWDGQ